MINIVKPLLVLLLFVSCTHNTNRQVKIDITDTTTVESGTLDKYESIFEFDTTIYHNNRTLFMQTIDPGYNSDTLLLSISIDSATVFTMYIGKGGLGDVIFKDFNNDNNLDFWILYLWNEGMLYLFDTENNTFRIVEGFERFRNIEQVKTNPNYYYSYVATGCADLNWVSKLFTIKGFETIELGYIVESACDRDEGIEIGKDEEPGMKIYRVLNNDEDNKRLLEKPCQRTFRQMEIYCRLLG